MEQIFVQKMALQKFTKCIERKKINLQTHVL